MNGFRQPLRLQALMASFGLPWFIAGGWAIDLFVGRVTREHKDIEIAIFRHDQEALRHFLADWDLQIAAAGRLRPWVEGEWILQPLHEMHAFHEHGDPPRFEVLLNDVEDGQWVFRRDQSIRRPVEEIAVVSRQGIPFLAPEIALLYKSKSTTALDQQDFEHALPMLNAQRCQWLRTALLQTSPVHPWLDALR